MLKPLFVAAGLAAVLLGQASGAGLATVPTIKDASFQAEILNAHNTERRSLGIGDLKWSDDLAEDAEAWAAKLAKSGALKHAGVGNQGENLWMGGAGRSSPSAMVGLWLAEKKNYLPGRAQPDVSKTGNWADVGHYTAIVWSATTSVGCAVSRNASHDFLVCRYSTPGNVTGYAAYDVNAAKRVAEAKPKPTPAPPPAKVIPSENPAPAATPVKQPADVPVPLPIAKPDAVKAT